ncbi:hypothetical protein D9M71_416590 [compost metagenome]
MRRLNGSSWLPSSTRMRLARGDRASGPLPPVTDSTSKVRLAVLWNTPSWPAESTARKPLRRSSAVICTTGWVPREKSRMCLRREEPSGSRAMNHWAMPPPESPTISEMPPSSMPLAVTSRPPSSSSL